LSRQPRAPRCGLKIDRVYIRDPKTGRITGRKEGVWSSYGDACATCKRSDRPHEAKGYCQACYVRWKYANDSEYRERTKRQQKARSIKSNYQEEYDRKRRGTAKRKRQRREISRRYARKNAKWRQGLEVVYFGGSAPAFAEIVSEFARRRGGFQVDIKFRDGRTLKDVRIRTLAAVNGISAGELVRIKSLILRELHQSASLLMESIAATSKAPIFRELKRKGQGEPTHDHAFWNLITEHRGFINHLAKRYGGGYIEAEELAQEAIAKASRCWTGLKNVAAFPGWMKQVVWSVSGDHLRRPSHKRRSSIDQADLERIAITKSPDSAAIDSVYLDAVLVELAHDDALLLLLQSHGLTAIELARALKTTVPAIKSRLYRAIDRSREIASKFIVDERLSA